MPASPPDPTGAQERCPVCDRAASDWMHPVGACLRIQLERERAAHKEALDALEGLEAAYHHVANCVECGEYSPTACAELEGENSDAAKALKAAADADTLLRKAGRRP